MHPRPVEQLPALRNRSRLRWKVERLFVATISSSNLFLERARTLEKRDCLEGVESFVRNHLVTECFSQTSALCCLATTVLGTI